MLKIVVLKVFVSIFSRGSGRLLASVGLLRVGEAVRWILLVSLVDWTRHDTTLENE